ncbi:MAG: hypothetical protein U0989_03350 [Azonexus sp.]|nr:hypothetical protein [Azonexus sp.]
MPQWTPIPGALATYIGKTKANKRNVRVLAEGVAGCMYVEAVGRFGSNVRFTVKRENLVQPQPDLFDSR